MSPACCCQMRVEQLERELRGLEETQTSYLDQIEELTHKLSQAEAKLQDTDNVRVEEGAKVTQTFHTLTLHH